MICTIITPTERTVLIDVPDEYLGKEVEVIAFVISETTPANEKTLTHFASEKVLAKDWLTPEVTAWQDL